VRSVLPAVRVPTLVLHRIGDLAVDVAEGRYLAEHIPGAKLAELLGDDHLWWVGDSEAIVNQIQEFLTGERGAADSDRALLTVLFTDIVESTRRSAQLGDHRWRDVLQNHNTLLDRQVERFKGRLVKQTGDGILATFDGPGRAVNCALTASEELRSMGLSIRAGLHTGEVQLLDGDIGGLAVNAAARVMERAAADEVWTSRTVKDLLAGSRFRFDERGTFSLKGIPDEMPLFAARI
jgi:class 3 adenylate cyclase